MQVVILAALADQNYSAQLVNIEFGLCYSNKLTGFIDPLNLDCALRSDFLFVK